MIELKSNECIKEDFETAARIAEMLHSVDEKCGFESTQKLTKISKLDAVLKTQAKAMTSLKSENSKLKGGKVQAGFTDKRTIFVLVFIAAVLSSTSSISGPCEKVEKYSWSLGRLKTCFMNSTVIDTRDFMMIASDRDGSIEGFYAYRNKKLNHLPNNLGEKFPLLLVLNAACCLIKEVSKENFRGLNKLRDLRLYHNQIEKIDDDTFEYIPTVEVILLCK